MERAGAGEAGALRFAPMDKKVSFQNYDDVSDAVTGAPRLAALRSELARRGLDGFVVPHADEHQSEYLSTGGILFDAWPVARQLQMAEYPVPLQYAHLFGYLRWRYAQRKRCRATG